MKLHYDARRFFEVVLSAFLSLSTLSPACAQVTGWIRQLGSPGDDVSDDLTVDSLGNVYVSGLTYGNLGGPNAGNADSFVAKYNADGNLQWTTQIGSPTWDWIDAISADEQGNVYAAGYNTGALGGPTIGGFDALLIKFNSSGELLWTKRVGTTVSDVGLGVAADEMGNVFLSGYTDGSLGGPSAGNTDTFVGKYDADGNLLWMRQFGTSQHDEGLELATDGAGNVIVAGNTDGSLGGPNAGVFDAFLTKYDAEGAFQWSRQIGTSTTDWLYSVSANALGDAYITGFTFGKLGDNSAGSTDIFLAKYDASGNLQWAEQLGTAAAEEGRDVFADDFGNVYITGYTYGSLSGPNAGETDAFLSKYDSAGNALWTKQIGSDSFDYAYGVAAFSPRAIFVSGGTTGNLARSNAGGMDAFVMKFVPEPTTVALSPVGWAILWLLGGRMRSK